ncbi:hypothetical protein FOMPIDRAFT_125858 [Fomitopsis schrenkii]|uniref:NADP-dependent oxidoreductase domain-containing protein n=1 Tax=Fomitopsis schrenkii TaxID=2126942 RepID=S8FSW8_FOMSC|nr:hypothetical protein FOMPIDRAFT_125858 [Fomitopsis schrenkii]
MCAQAQYRQLGKSGLRVSVPILGGMSVGSPQWAPWVLSEEKITENIIILDKIFFPVAPDVATFTFGKFALANTRDYVNRTGLSRAAIVNEVEASLRRLDTSYLQIHAFDNALHGWTPFTCVQVEHSLLYRAYEAEMFTYCAYKTETLRTKCTTGGVFDKKRHPCDHAIIKRVQVLAEKHGWSMAQVALAWSVSSPIVGANSPDQLRACMTTDKALTKEEMTYLQAPWVSPCCLLDGVGP